MLEKLGKRALATPVIIGIVLCCILSLAVSPLFACRPTQRALRHRQPGQGGHHHRGNQ